jgi:hypothetical protein
VKGNQAMNQRVAKRARQAAAEEEAEDSSVDSQLLRRRRIDAHPDAPPVAPIRADRDLPEGGLDPAKPVPVDYGLNSAPLPDQAERHDEPADEYLLEDDGDFLDLGFAEQLDEPAPPARAVAPAPAADQSLGAMVARFEAGLDKRRNRPAADAAATVPAPAPANEDDGPAVDLALEAALATLQRMSKSAVG